MTAEPGEKESWPAAWPPFTAENLTHRRTTCARRPAVTRDVAGAGAPVGAADGGGDSAKQFNAELAGEQATTLAEANKVIDADFPADNYVMVMIGKASEIGALAPKYGMVVAKKIGDAGY